MARFLSKPHPRQSQPGTARIDRVAATLRQGDVLLVEGTSRISASIKYLTQSTWSHAALCLGDALGPPPAGEEPRILLEADINEGVRAVPLSQYAGLHTRICRPVGLRPVEIDAVVAFAVERIGYKYDLKNILDLIRYMIETPPAPNRWRRRLLALGSGDPTRAICSSLIAQAFQSVRYPILPEVFFEKSTDPNCVDCYREILHIRHHSLYAPRDFDISPYFEIVKPTIAQGFDPHVLAWAESTPPLPADLVTRAFLNEPKEKRFETRDSQPPWNTAAPGVAPGPSSSRRS